jgi:hypothetical protein
MRSNDELAVGYVARTIRPAWIFIIKEIKRKVSVEESGTNGLGFGLNERLQNAWCFVLTAIVNCMLEDLFYMMLKLQKVSGLDNDSPIHKYLGETDRILKYERTWSEVHRRIPVDELYEGMLFYLGHPMGRRDVEDEDVKEYVRWLLECGEQVFANLLTELLTLLVGSDIRLVMMWILANLEYLKQKEGGVRSIDAGWLDE